MPADFEKCQRNGGRIRTISGPSKQFNLNAEDFMRVCFLGGDMFRGEVKRKREGSK